MKITIIGGTIDGNKGAAAMVYTAIRNLNAEFDVLTIYPKKDKILNKESNVNIVSAKPFELIAWITPLAAVAGVAKKLKLSPIVNLCKKNSAVKSFEEADLIIDVGGISFVDGRGVYVIYNSACILPGILVGTPVIKWAQALGPFKTVHNKIPAKLLLPKLKKIIARGNKTKEHLSTLNLNNVIAGADSAFLLPITKKEKEKIKNMMKPAIESTKEIVGISTSSVVQKYCEKKGIDYSKIMAEFCEYLIERKYQILLIPNAIRRESKKLKNNDIPVTKEILSKVKEKIGNENNQIMWFDEDFYPGEIKSMIGECDLFVGSRFHAMIAAIGMGVPSFVVGWSHKYREVLAMVECEQYCIDFAHLKVQDLISKFEELEDNQEKIRENINKNLPQVIQKSQVNIDIVREFENTINKNKEKSNQV